MGGGDGLSPTGRGDFVHVSVGKGRGKGGVGWGGVGWASEHVLLKLPIRSAPSVGSTVKREGRKGARKGTHRARKHHPKVTKEARLVWWWGRGT